MLLRPHRQCKPDKRQWKNSFPHLHTINLPIRLVRLNMPVIVTHLTQDVKVLLRLFKERLFVTTVL